MVVYFKVVVYLFYAFKIVFVSGGNVVKVWDALAGGKQLTQLCHHHKTVTSLAFCSRHRRFMSASIDRCVSLHYYVIYVSDVH
jgi:U3 small nucleolar RNA-associated protein 15